MLGEAVERDDPIVREALANSVEHLEDVSTWKASRDRPQQYSRHPALNDREREGALRCSDCSFLP
jgi:hypothetical protein